MNLKVMVFLLRSKVSLYNKVRNRIYADLGLAGYLLRRSVCNPVILMFHGVTKDLGGIGSEKHISHVLFRKQLSLLKKYYQFIELDNLIDDSECVNLLNKI